MSIGRDHKCYTHRRRDVQLHLCGHVVLRFTNEQVLADVETVVRKIEQLLSQRRETNTHYLEMGQHVDD